MAEPAGGLAGAADVLTKLSSLFSSAPLKPAEKRHDLTYTTKAKHGPRIEDFIQRSALLIYIVVLLIFSVRGCGINQRMIPRDTALPPMQPVIHNE